MDNSIKMDHVDYIGYGQDVNRLHETKATGRTIATWLGIIAAIIFFVAVFAIFMRNRIGEKSTEKETNVNLGETNGEVRALRAEVGRLIGYERQDFGKISFNEGFLYGGGEKEHHCGCGHGHGRKGGCESKFEAVETFTSNGKTLMQKNSCDCG